MWVLLAGAEDHYVPIEQFFDQLQTLTRARSVTGRLFTRAEEAHNHVQLGNVGLSLDVFMRWMWGLDERDRQQKPATRDQ